MRTDIGQLIGTVPYMSPEQVTGDPGEVDTRSDVYSLGVLLYQLMCGRLPYELRNKTIPETVRIIREDEPTPLSSISRTFRGDIATIAARALEKEKSHRYQSAADLAADVRHFLRDEPIVARPPSTFYQLRKFARRNKALVGGVAVAFAAMVLGTVFSVWQALYARAEASKALAINEYLEELLVSPDPFSGVGRDVTIADLLSGAAEDIDTRFASHPEVALRLRLIIGRTYWGLGRAAEAEAELRRVYETARERLGAEDPLTLEAMGYLVDSLLKQHRQTRKVKEEAIPLARRLVALRRRVNGDDDPATLEAIEFFCWALVASPDERDLETAEQILRETLPVAERARGAHYMTWRLKHVLMRDLNDQYRFAEAEQMAPWLLDWVTQHPGEALHATRVMNILAYAVGYQGDLDRSATLAAEAYERRLEQLGPNHLWTRESLARSGLNEQWRGGLDQAHERFAEYLRISSAVDDQVIHAKFLLIRLEMLRGAREPAEALDVFRAFVAKTTEPMQRFWGEMALTAQALCLARLGRYEEAERVMRRHPGELMDAIAPDHYERRLYLNTWVEIYEGLGDAEKAAEYWALLRAAEERRLRD
jgi:tetratricopeptide (TPR) repeat protein